MKTSTTEAKKQKVASPVTPRITPNSKILGVSKTKNGYALLGRETRPRGDRLFITTSPDGIEFSATKKTITITDDSGKKVVPAKVKSANISLQNENSYVLSYNAVIGNRTRLYVATSKNLTTWKTTGKILTPSNRAFFFEDTEEKSSQKSRTKWTALTGVGAVVKATSNNLKTWRISEKALIASRSGSFDSHPLSLLGMTQEQTKLACVYLSEGVHGNGCHSLVGIVIFDRHNVERVVMRSDMPVYELLSPESKLHAISAIFETDRLLIYFENETEGNYAVVILPNPLILRGAVPNLLKRSDKNPIIAPIPTNSWESEATFNPAAYFDGKKVHLLYRAVGSDGRSVLGYAASSDGVHIHERLPYPIYGPRYHFESAGKVKPSVPSPLASGPGWGGCEDPKLIEHNGRLLMTYVAFDGWNNLTTALTSISLEDFHAKKWHWTAPQVMARPIRSERDGQMSNVKSACILPEKINGKFVTFFRVFPDICIDYRDDLTFGEGKWLKIDDKITTRPNHWDNLKISIGATPLKTNAGWLVIYSGVDMRDYRYKMGAMLLALDDPKTVLCRTSAPILMPDETYENEGKAGIIYPCGSAMIDKTLYVYYGGGDKYVCAAACSTNDLLHHLQSQVDVPFRLEPVRMA